MIELDIPESVRMHAKKLAEELIRRYKGRSNSIRDGEGHYHAKIVELLLEIHYDIIPKSTYDYDQIVIAHDGQQYKTENKVKQRTVVPEPHFLASVALSNLNQKCDRYLFASLLHEDKCFLMGWYDAEEFRTKSFLGRKGEIDPTDKKGIFRFTTDCRNLPYSELKPFYKG